MLLRIFCAVLLFVGVTTAASFDPPKSKKTVNLGPSRSSPGVRAKVNCYFYSAFMVKEVDLGEKGADRLSIVPIAKGVLPRCARVRSKTEMVVNPDEWSGYFKGVKSDLVFFDADDGWNGGMPFAIYDSHTGKKIFNDAAVGNLEFLPATAPGLSMKYTRIIESECNAFKDPDACWLQIQKKIGLENVTRPDCKKGYEKSAQELARGRCEAQKTNNPQCIAKELPLAQDQTYGAASVIAYPVEVTLGSQPTIKPQPGELRCWPSD